MYFRLFYCAKTVDILGIRAIMNKCDICRKSRKSITERGAVMPKGKHILSSMPKGKHVFGTVKIGEKGQIVIPKEARQVFGLSPGDSLLVLGDEENGIVLAKAEVLNSVALKILGQIDQGKESEE